MWVGAGGHTFAINPYTRLKPTPAPVGGPLGMIDFVFARNRAVVQNRCAPVEVRFRIFGVVARRRQRPIVWVEPGETCLLLILTPD